MGFWDYVYTKDGIIEDKKRNTEGETLTVEREGRREGEGGRKREIRGRMLNRFPGVIDWK